ncbi:helix-turn-helix domain-containing protein (plasmid) [Iamia sp. SCSIO 61187]|uniref:helix-turn-helix domain-containing protein n=1 Tax=Iamia sp. SCSIO 61187 TaxID=2722752 RepID=UPI001C62ECDC|nr:helix-turn-helix domain-containing protein [Iamia sp. SCSIO 61187]QYG95856.1 helix-turn-helix domain-containing protein [Iamia sp. SCSIO 61187]
MDAEDEAEWAELAEDEWLTGTAVCRVLGIGPHTLDELVSSGLLRAYRPHKHRRYRRSHVLAYLRSREVRPGDPLDPPTEE